ncbi:unnamed protein product [Clonostachys solani]|uniref:Uncharacterized protein n=1 Tax=Clonostachys solani TaxID=160281 RepID=A0A9P0ENX0_9HYPO|nr:unnamed protein product [Clonostachys solani]
MSGAPPKTILLLASAYPLQPSQPRMQQWVIVSDTTQGALHHSVVRGVKANQGREQAHVRFRQAIAEEEFASIGETRLESVQGGEEGCDVFVIRFLCSGETNLVDAVVDVAIYPFVELINILA